MPTTTRLIEELPSRLAAIAARIEVRRRGLGLSQVALADRCNAVRDDLFAPTDLPRVPQMSRERIAKILMARHAQPRPNAARALYPYELQLLAHALDVSVEWLHGPDDEHPIVVWNPVTDPHGADVVLDLIAMHQRAAAEQVSWAEALPWSFMTPAFLRAYHRARLAAHRPRTRVEEQVRLFERIGTVSRARLLADAAARPWRFTHHMRLSDLEMLSAGARDYAVVPANVRVGCLANVMRLVSDHALRIGLVVAEDDALGPLETSLHDVDALLVVGRSLAMWRDHSGMLYWSEHPRFVAAKRGILRRFAARARYRHPVDVLTLLQGLRAAAATPLPTPD